MVVLTAIKNILKKYVGQNGYVFTTWHQTSNVEIPYLSPNIIMSWSFSIVNLVQSLFPVGWGFFYLQFKTWLLKLCLLLHYPENPSLREGNELVITKQYYYSHDLLISFRHSDHWGCFLFRIAPSVTPLMKKTTLKEAQPLREKKEDLLLVALFNFSINIKSSSPRECIGY